jgi:hypothetical protein
MTTSSACVLLLTLCGSAFAAGTTTVPLEPKAYRTFELLLPQERFADVGAGFVVPHGASDRFTTTLEGDRLRVDLDGDGTCEALVEGETGFVTLARTAADGRSLAYSVRLKREPGQAWTYSCGSAMAGRVDDVLIQVFDQDLNGRFDDYGVDAMIVGKSTVASYLSKVVAIGDRLVSVSVATDGSTLDVAPYEGSTGTLDLRSGFTCKAKLDAAIVRSVGRRALVRRVAREGRHEGPRGRVSTRERPPRARRIERDRARRPLEADGRRAGCDARSRVGRPGHGGVRGAARR